MQCPKCQSNMEKVPTHEGVADRCTVCKGIWFDMLEYEDMKASANIVDTGDARTGKQYNKIDRIDCPVCPNSRMLRMVDPNQAHIWFESCPVCYGRFYDAGEFRDFSERTIADFFRQFSVRARD
jgi:uncharacterized protein